MTIACHAYARAGLLGNPSDGYFGKIIAVSVKNFSARVSLNESLDLWIKPSEHDASTYPDIQALVEHLNQYGYYGGIRLIKAAIKKFWDYCKTHKLPLNKKNFTLRYSSDIPRQLGLGGSSAIITAAIKALIQFYSINIPQEILPSLILNAELEELGINAGFMDRVIQVYEGCMYMDLDQKIIDRKGHGLYERFDPNLLPPLYLAYKPSLGKVSGKVLNDIRLGWDRKDPFVIKTLARIAEIAAVGKKALTDKNYDLFFSLMNENFDLRSRIMKISPGNLEMIKTARNCGVSAKFAGSGGAVIGMYNHEDTFERLKKELDKIGAITIKPIID
ncbi:MAG: GHMP kinase [Candidatus Aminicenantes bacterium]|nr:GHMP kinase [Candidatus Aminicenantes bacterium]